MTDRTPLGTELCSSEVKGRRAGGRCVKAAGEIQEIEERYPCKSIVQLAALLLKDTFNSLEEKISVRGIGAHRRDALLSLELCKVSKNAWRQGHSLCFAIVFA